MTEFTTVGNLLATGADGAPAVGAPGRATLDFAGLRALAERTVRDLNGLSIGRGDRVAIVLPNGPEMATAFLAIACGATTGHFCAPPTTRTWPGSSSPPWVAAT